MKNYLITIYNHNDGGINYEINAKVFDATNIKSAVIAFLQKPNVLLTDNDCILVEEKMTKKYTDEQIIKYMEKHTGCKNGFITRDDEGRPTTYEAKEDNGFVFAFLEDESTDELDYHKIQ